MTTARIKVTMRVTMESTTVEVTVSRTNSAQPIVAMPIATIVPLRKHIARTMDVAGIIPLIVAKMTVSHASIKAVTTGVIITSITVVESGRNFTAKVNATAIFTNHVLIRTKIAA